MLNYLASVNTYLQLPIGPHVNIMPCTHAHCSSMVSCQTKYESSSPAARELYDPMSSLGLGDNVKLLG
jgi:hypothetical protein